MFKLGRTELEGLTWKPRHYIEIDGVRYGYDKCAPEELALPGVVIDLVRLKSNRVIPDHYHARGIERFSVLDGEGILQTRYHDDDPRLETQIVEGDIFTINPGERHRVINVSNRALYLFRCATEGKDSIFTEHPEVFQ